MKLSLALVASVALVAYASANYALPSKRKSYFKSWYCVGLVNACDAAYKPVKGGTYNSFTLAKIRAHASVKLAFKEGLFDAVAASRNYEYKTKNFMVNPFGSCSQQGTAKKGEKKHMLFVINNHANCVAAFEGSLQAEDWMADALIIPCTVRTGDNKFAGLTGMGGWYYEKAHRTTANVSGAYCAYAIHDRAKPGWVIQGCRSNHQKSYADLVSYLVGVTVSDWKCGSYLLTAGHSLGGHIASVAQQRSLNRDMNYKTSDTFPGVYVSEGSIGSPRAYYGVEYWTSFLRCMKFNEEHYRAVNYRDIVPTLPPKAFHLHTGKKIHIYPGFNCQKLKTKAYPFGSKQKSTWASKGNFLQLWLSNDSNDDNPPITIPSALTGENMYLPIVKFIIGWISTGSADFSLIGVAVKNGFKDYCDLGEIFKMIKKTIENNNKSDKSSTVSNNKGVMTTTLTSSQNSKTKSKAAKFKSGANSVCKAIGPWKIATWTWWLTGAYSHLYGQCYSYMKAARSKCPYRMDQSCKSYDWARMYWRSSSKKKLYDCMNKRCKMVLCADYPQYKYHSIGGGRTFTSANT